jgi:hypothetical protein
VELNFTDVAPVKFVPVIVTKLPAIPLEGLKLVMAGAAETVKSVADDAVPADVVTAILPLVELPATTARICVELSTEKFAAAVPLNVTALAPVKFVPESVTVVPVAPEGGAKLPITGAAGGVWFEVAVPQDARKRDNTLHANASVIPRASGQVNVCKYLTLNQYALGPAGDSNGLSMQHCWSFGGAAQGCLSTKTLVRTFF